MRAVGYFERELNSGDLVVFWCSGRSIADEELKITPETLRIKKGE